ncbi:hypothetical protein GGR26_000448 [Lewinella marina]|uniref:VCBS repeat-containing protein n=1 Tax=Neolewinella marina TaxID=438751 RepID=A0A2G0CJN2_9BACT|nr:VCBS repeat-containing protein [Neolewinella marina]NJB84703.1 hypothetical protein [Neolewinella marina]PHL00131.1 hypothetical protein CGL56_03555 [Neolewinella marina]
MRKLPLYGFLLGLGVLLLGRCTPKPQARELVERHCGSCHLPPDPAALPRAIWEQRVLPEMGARMGMRSMTYDPAGQLAPEEYDLAVAHGFYPDLPTLSYDDWTAIQAYILERAPAALPPPPALPLDSLPGFAPRFIDVDGKGGSLVTFLAPGPDGLAIGDGYGQLHLLDPTGKLHKHHGLTLPLVHYQPTPTGDLLLEIGNIYPTEARNGKLYRVADGRSEVVADSLHRPVHLLVEDLDGDGQAEIVVSEFGNYSGALTLLRPEGRGGYTRSRLLGAAGATRVVATDLNRDGRQDLVVLHAQGDEGIDALYQRPDGGFSREQLLRFSPVWGTSWFELVDYDRDGDLDLVTVHGDNADYSNVRKPYHGLRIFANAGDQTFSEVYFQPLPGATRVVARDFDADGDLDLAVACNFADYATRPEASFVYLEGTPPHPADGTPTFRAFTTPAALEGRWLILEAGDFDGDGDDDIALGSFTLNPAPVPDSLETRWREGTTDVLLLENLREGTLVE